MVQLSCCTASGDETFDLHFFDTENVFQQYLDKCVLDWYITNYCRRLFLASFSDLLYRNINDDRITNNNIYYININILFRHRGNRNDTITIENYTMCFLDCYSYNILSKIWHFHYDNGIWYLIYLAYFDLSSTSFNFPPNRKKTYHIVDFIVYVDLRNWNYLVWMSYMILLMN